MLLEWVVVLVDVIWVGGDEVQQLCRVFQVMIDALIDVGLFCFIILCQLGGEDVGVREIIEVFEVIVVIDVLVGWNVMFGFEINVMVVGVMDLVLVKEVYVDNFCVVMCGGGGLGFVFGRVVVQFDGGFKVWGQLTFISGCYNSTWCFMFVLIFDGDVPWLVDGWFVV